MPKNQVLHASNRDAEQMHSGDVTDARLTLVVTQDGYALARKAVDRRVNRHAPARLVHPLLPASRTECVVFSTARCDKFQGVRKSDWRRASTAPGLSDRGTQGADGGDSRQDAGRGDVRVHEKIHISGPRGIALAHRQGLLTGGLEESGGCPRNRAGEAIQNRSLGGFSVESIRRTGSSIRSGALRLITISVSWRGTLAVVVRREHCRASKTCYGRTCYEKRRDWVLGTFRNGGDCLQRDEGAAEGDLRWTWAEE